MDCMDGIKEFPDKYFDLAIVDPPYGIGEDGLKNHSRSNKAKAKKYTPKNWDNKPPDAEYFKELQRVSKNQIIWGANHFIENIPNANSSSWIVWDKVNGENDFADCELAWTSFNTAAKLIPFMWSGMMQGKSIKEGRTMQGNKKLNEIRIHPTQKPVAIYEWLLLQYANKGDKIIDTHVGSASSLVACYNLGFDCVGFEKDTDYFSGSEKRLKQVKAQVKLSDLLQVDYGN